MVAELESWGDRRDWYGPDPYEAMNSRLLVPLARTRLARRALIQLVKRSPLDLRRPLAISPAHNPATIAHLLSAYCRLGSLDPEHRMARIRWAIGLLEAQRRPDYDEPCWSYHFDVETRFFFYSARTPNTIATAFAGLALIDAYEATGEERLLELAMGTGRFFLDQIPRTETATGTYFGYFPTDRTPIHNASLLASAVLAELAARGGPEAFAAAAREGAAYAAAGQRTDGSWPYAEGPVGDWVDNFHTGYVLDALGRICSALGDAGADRARRRGLEYYARELFEADGAPRFFADSLYPIDGQCVAQAISSFSAAAELDRGWLAAAWQVFEWGARRMRRRDGAFLFQRRRLWVNPTPHVRWVQAPMLEALSRLAVAAEGKEHR